MLSHQAIAALDNAPTTAQQNTDFYTITYHYFTGDFASVLMLTDVAREQHGFALLSGDNADRLSLMVGASQLKLGLLNQAQASFRALLAKYTSPYIQARTWFWLAKSGFSQQQLHLSQQAYQFIVDNDLIEQLSPEQWQELTYLSAHAQLLTGNEWQKTAQQLAPSGVYLSYLHGAQGALHYNEGEWAQAQQAFVDAKQQLLKHQTSTAKSPFARRLWPVNWFGLGSSQDDSIGRTAAMATEHAQVLEQNELFDYLNLQLAQTLIQQNAHEQALGVLNNVSVKSGIAKQAMLTLGWTLAQENRWQLAINTWQTLLNEGGLYSVQASFALGYAYQQQNQNGNAFFALQRTIELIEQTLAMLDNFETQVKSETFFDDYQQRWPESLGEIKSVFLTGESDNGGIDTVNVLAIREQSRAIVLASERQAQQLELLQSVLDERKQRVQSRQQGLTLAQAEQQIAARREQLTTIERLLHTANDISHRELINKMMPQALAKSAERLAGAKVRHARLRDNPPKNRPLKPSYAQRLERLSGIVQWQSEAAYVATKWQHQRLLQNAKLEMESAHNQLKSLQTAQQEAKMFASEQGRIRQLDTRITQQRLAAQETFDHAQRLLSTYLLEIVNARKHALQQRLVSTRLLRVRLQDLHYQSSDSNMLNGQSMKGESE